MRIGIVSRGGQSKFQSYLENLAINIVATLLLMAAVALFSYWRRDWYTFACMSVLAILLLWAMRASWTVYQLRRAGILRCYPRFEKAPRFTEDIICKKEITDLRMVGISLRSLSKDDRFINLLRKHTNKMARLHFLLLDPESKHLLDKAKAMGTVAESWQADVLATIGRLHDLKEGTKFDIQVRLYDSWPLWHMYIVNEEEAWVGFYPTSPQHIHDFPFLLVVNCSNSIYDLFYQQFDILWSASKPIESQDLIALRRTIL